MSQSEEEDIQVAKKLFFGGCAFLPFLWLANAFYFRDVIKNPQNHAVELRKCL